MKYRYTGPQDEITLREVTFEKGKTVDLSDNPELAEKVAVLADFKKVKARKNGNKD
jgi:hypothetical protein